MRKSVFRLEGVSVAVGGETSLSDFSLEMYEGEIMGVVGPSNSGKTSLCRVLAGTARYHSGTLYYREQLLKQNSVPSEIARRVSLIEYNSELPTGLTVAEGLALVDPRSRGRLFMNHKQIRMEAERTLAALSIHIPPDAYLYQLSMAQQHMVRVAAAWLQKADLIVLNNTISSYTAQEWESVKQTLRIVLKTGAAVLITSNRETRLVQVCDHVAVLGQRTNLKIFEPSDYLVLRSVMEQLQQNVEIVPVQSPVRYSSDSRVFRASSLSTESLKSGSIELYRGEIVGIFDANNIAGQELFSAMMTMDPACGRFELEGEPVERMTVSQALGRGIGFMPEHAVNHQLFLPQSVMDNVLCASRKKLGNSFLFRRRALEHLAATSAEKIGIEQRAMDARAEQFDHLGRLRIYLSRWDYVRIQLLICNCALETADLPTKKELKHFFRSLAAKGAAVCLFGYDGADLLEICDSIYVIENDSISRKHTNHEAKGLLGR